ncbi:hypothetical protein PoB_000124500 [Plakobranchus ocellatus]|uniref:Uncharacterized protein n=1 Tax=Plakobranchus ocellatus TaxID=259542 RepID=A0AAV3XWE6_9GAST|nr:hypothetical protein PoB_000124500 [Plakobranchus ocellatus]
MYLRYEEGSQSGLQQGGEFRIWNGTMKLQCEKGGEKGKNRREDGISGLFPNLLPRLLGCQDKMWVCKFSRALQICRAALDTGSRVITEFLLPGAMVWLLSVALYAD